MIEIDYKKESEKYRPKEIKILLVGEAPPSNKKTYFYIPKPMNPNRNIKNYISLPATIFNHYSIKIPLTEKKYITALKKLQKRRIFLIDIIDEPIRVRKNPIGLYKVKREIKNLRIKMKMRKIKIEDKNIIFLLARNDYRRDINNEFPNANKISWVNFRINQE